MKYKAIAAAPPGWVAVYKDEEVGFIQWPVCAWVIVEDEDGSTFVAGVDPTGEGWDGRICEDTTNFVEYKFVGRVPPPLPPHIGPQVT